MFNPRNYATRNTQLLAKQIEAFRSQADMVRPDWPAGGNAVAEINRPDLIQKNDVLQPQREADRQNLNFVVENLKYGDFAHIPFSVGSTGNSVPILTRPQGKRTLLIVENTHLSQNLYVGFGIVPDASIGITIPPGGNLFLDNVVPQNDIYLAGQSTATTGNITYSNQELGQ